MNIKYTIYNFDNEIIKHGSCIASSLNLQPQDGEFLIIGHINPETHKIVNHIAVQKTQEETNQFRLNKQLYQTVAFNGQENDETLNQKISDHFYGLIDVQQWRHDNYKILRKKFYPDAIEYNDAQVKINSGDPSLYAEGMDQQIDYIEKCFDVKIRFPKE